VEEELVPVGRVGRPHGRDGSFVVEEASEDADRFAVGATLWVGGRAATVVAAKRSAGRPVIRLDQPVQRGQLLSVPRSQLPPTEEGSYYVFQLVGLVVEEEGGRRLGRVRDVLPGVANDVLDLEDGRLLPMHEECVREIDLERGRILVARGFADPG
jgi:16S rRNA processing protein RimM